LATAALALGAQSAFAQHVIGCPAGQALQALDVSGRRFVCVPIPDTAALQGQISNEAAAREAMDANILNMLGAETAGRQAADGAEAAARQAGDGAEAAARQAADNALGARIDGLTEVDIVGRWSSSGTTSCLQSSNGFTANLSPLIPSTGTTAVSQLSNTFVGARTFNAGGTGRSTGTSSSMTSPATLYGAAFAGFGSSGGASVTTLDGNFAWSIQPDGTLLVDDGNTIVQQFTAPPVRVGSTVTIENRPSYVGSISKDRRTITLTHQGMSLETSITRDPNGAEVNRSPRFCARHRVLIRLPD